MTTAEMQAESERLNGMCDDVLSFNLQGANRTDHIVAAEGLLALYEASVKLNLNVLAANKQDMDGEGTLALFRHAAALHVAIANVLPV